MGNREITHCQKRKSSAEKAVTLVNNAESTQRVYINLKMTTYVNNCNYSTLYIVQRTGNTTCILFLVNIK